MSREKEEQIVQICIHRFVHFFIMISDARRIKIAAAGYDYAKVQAKVNKILKNK